MRAYFFGKYLLAQALIDPDQLNEALVFQREKNKVLGELAREKGVCLTSGRWKISWSGSLARPGIAARWRWKWGCSIRHSTTNCWRCSSSGTSTWEMRFNTSWLAARVINPQKFLY